MDKCKHKWIISNNEMSCSYCHKLNNDKCYYCHNAGPYADFKDGVQVSLCFNHLGDYSS